MKSLQLLSSLQLLLSSLLLSLQSTVTVQAASSIIYQTSVGVSVGPGNGFSEGRPSDDIAYLTTANGNLYTIQESTGTILNTLVSDGATLCNTIVEWNPDYTTGVYAVGNTIHLINRDGTLQQSFDIEQGTVTDQPIIIKDDIVLVTSNDSTNGYISLYEAPRVFSRLTISGSFLGPLSAGSYNDMLYVGASNGFLLTVDIRDARNDAQLSVFGNGINFNQDMRGRAYATDSSLVVQTPAGDLYWWAGSDGNFNVQPDFTARLETEGSTYDSSIAPVLSKDELFYFIISGSTTYAYSNEGFATSSLLWSTSSSETKTKAVLLDDNLVYTVDRENGQIIKQDIWTGNLVGDAFPYTSTFGKASGAALLTNDGTSILTIHDSGILVATCVRNCNGETDAPTAPPALPATPAPVVPPTPAPVVPPTPAPVVPPTPAPVVPPTPAPVVPPTPAPVVPPTPAPVVPPTPAPVVPPTPAPVVPATPAPVVPPTPAPVVPATPAPVVPPTPAPVVPPTPAPVVPETAAPAVPETPAPVVPESAAPVVPETADPVVPETADPVVPETADPVAPETDAPVTGTPVATDTSTPVTGIPVATDTSTPVTGIPVATDTSAPVSTTTVAPVTSAPVTPVSTTTTAPVTGDPVTTTTNAPVTAAPVTPVSTVTTAPVTPAPVTPAPFVFSSSLDDNSGAFAGCTVVATLTMATALMALLF